MLNPDWYYCKSTACYIVSSKNTHDHDNPKTQEQYAYPFADPYNMMRSEKLTQLLGQVCFERIGYSQDGQYTAQKYNQLRAMPLIGQYYTSGNASPEKNGKRIYGIEYKSLQKK